MMGLFKGFTLLLLLTVGCDGVIGSSARKDHCGVCGGDNDSCRIIAGIFTRRRLKKGYNPITKIPAGSCHVNVTELGPSTNFIVLKYSNGTGVINGDQNILTRVGDYNAAGTTFRYGRREGAHCPGECLYAEGPLTDQVNIELLSSRSNKGIKYMFTIPKSMIESVMQSFQNPGRTRHQGHRRGSSTRQTSQTSSSSSSAQRQISYNQQPEYISPESPGRNAYGYQALQSNGKKLSSQQVANRYQENYKKGQVESQTSNKLHSSSNRGVPLSNTNNGVPLSSSNRGGSQSSASRGVPLAKPLAKPNRGVPLSSRTSNTIPQGTGYSNSYNRRVNYIDSVPLAPPVQTPYTGTGTSSSSSASGQTYNRQYPQTGVQYNTYNRNVVTNQRQELIVPDTIDEVNFHWTISGFTECSRSCGGGRQDTIMACIKRKTNVQVTDENCDPAKKKIQTIVCNKSPCPPDWEEGPWTLCSVTCGQGLQTRRVECKQRYSQNFTISVSAQMCNLNQRPVTTQSCQTRPCAEWRTSNWTKCSVDCGIGEMSRTVDCADTANKSVSERQCAGAKPDNIRRCDMGTCAKGWFQTAWSESCSTECGPGFHTRTVYCSAADGSPLPETKCGYKPRTQKPCKKTRPCGGFWFEGPWSQCRASCGSEMQKRDVICMKKLDVDLFAVVDKENCKEYIKPETEKPCPTLPECQPQWYMTKWSECSKSCGTGVKTRDSKCLATDKTPSFLCTQNAKPSLRRSCNTQECDLPQLDEDPGCKDSWSQCRLVVQARLCPYKYYKEKCCHACTLHHLKHKRDKAAAHHGSS